MAGTLTWLGHAAFRLDTPGGKRIYLDPWLSNPKCPDAEKTVERVDVVALTHGHEDHVGEAIEILKQHRPALIAPVELQGWIADQGVDWLEVPGLNRGGSRAIDGVTFTMTDARHSSSTAAGYAGGECGIVMKLEDGFTIYFAGDTCAFLDMQLIARLHEPDLAVLPIGDHFTMGPREAAVALELLGVRRCVPCHYGTFPLLRGTPDELREHAPGVEVHAPEPGGSVEL